MVPTTMGGRPCGLPPIVFLGLLQALYNFVFWWYLLGMTLGWQSERHALGSEKRCSLKDLTGHLDMRKFTILLDHQPYHLEQAEEAGIDFQLSGHTHYGQMWPINWIEDVIYEKAYGALTKGNTQYYISSGIGIWGAKFRLGTQSEYVVAQLPITIKQNTAKNKRNRNAN